MRKPTRQIIFYCFLAAFLVAAPLVVLYTAGFRYNFQSGKIIQTGLLSVNTVPKGVTVVIDGQAYGTKTPVVIDNLYPGDHQIRLERSGFIVWEKVLPVYSRATTFIDTAVYLASEPQIAVPGKLDGLYPSHDGRAFVYVLAKEGWREVWINNPQTATEKLLARLPYLAGQSLAPAWSADNSYVSLLAKDARSQTVTLYHAGNLASTEITALVAGGDFWWDTQRGDTLFIENQGRLSYLRLPQAKPIATPITDAVLRTDGNDLLAAQKVADGVVLARWQGETSTILAYLPLGEYRFHYCPEPGFIMLQDLKRERILLIDANNSSQPVVLNAMAAIWRWEPDGRRLLYSDYFDLHVFDAATLTDQTLTRLSRPLTALAWHPGVSGIFYLQDDNLTAVDLDYRDGHFLTKLAAGSDFTALFIDQRGKTAYFTGTVGAETGLFARSLQK